MQKHIKLCFRGTGRPEILPFGEISKQTFELQRQQIHPTLTEAIGRQGSSKEYKSSLAIVNTIKARHLADANGSYINECEQFPQIEVKGMLTEDGWDKRHENIRRVYGTDGICPTIPTGQGGGVMTKIVAMRGRNPNNPSDRVAGNPTEQRLELNKEGTTNTLSSVQKDNLVVMDLYNHKEHSDRSPALTEPHHNTLRVRENMRIRRLTPRECERLQGFPDNWTKIIMSNGKGMSDTQRYKQMGNAVTVNVIQAIAEKLIELQ